MTTKQFNKLSMYLAVESVCERSPAAWGILPAWADPYTDMKLNVGVIQNSAQSQSVNHSGVAADKQAARQTMCALALPIGQAVHAYAVKTKNHTLAKNVDFSKSDLMQGRDVKSAERCQTIYNAANDNLANLNDYGITTPKLTALNGAIATYNLLIGKPRDIRVQGKTVTSSLPHAFAAADEDLVQLDDLLGQLTDQTFVSEFKNARIIVDIAATHETPATPTPPAPAPGS